MEQSSTIAPAQIDTAEFHRQLKTYLFKQAGAVLQKILVNIRGNAPSNRAAGESIDPPIEWGEVWGGVSPSRPTLESVVSSPSGVVGAERRPETHLGVF